MKEKIDETYPIAKDQTESTKTNQQKQPLSDTTLSSSLPTLRKIWIISCLVSIIVLSYGIYKNGGYRKYIPLHHPTALSSIGESLKHCRKVYANVHAMVAEITLTTNVDSSLLLCCDETNDNEWWTPCGMTTTTTNPRLTTLRGAWLLPLIPLLLRIAATLTGRNFRSISCRSNPLYLTRRLVMYIVVMNYRTWCLYVGLNSVERYFGNGMEEDDVCWYMKGTTRGCTRDRRWDFSDHVVLFYGQTLPIVLFESLFCFLGTEERRKKIGGVYGSWGNVAMAAVVIPYCLWFHLVTYLAAFKTAAYFHTVSEVIVGYLISLTVQVPMGFLVFSDGDRWVKLRTFFGLPP